MIGLLILTLKMDIDPTFLNAIMQVESSGNPKAFNSGSGARGLFQTTPVAWKDLVAHYPSYYGKLNYEKDIFNPEVSRRAGNDYFNILKGYLTHYKLPVNYDTLMAAYNFGIGNLREKGMGGLPKETVDYIRKVKLLLKEK